MSEISEYSEITFRTVYGSTQRILEYGDSINGSGEVGDGSGSGYTEHYGMLSRGDGYGTGKYNPAYGDGFDETTIGVGYQHGTVKDGGGCGYGYYAGDWDGGGTGMLNSAMKYIFVSDLMLYLIFNQRRSK